MADAPDMVPQASDARGRRQPAYRRFLFSLPGFWRVHQAYRRFIGWHEQHWMRVVMDRETARLVEGLDPPSLDVLEISGGDWAGRFDFSSFRSVFYPEFDICKGPLEDRFDLIIAEQVWEHLPWPYRAARHVHDMLRPGGHFLVTTPFLVRVHESPIDCCRWTETGMRHFLAEAGFAFDQIVTGSWGNRACVRANFWYRRRQWAHYLSRIHSLRNEPGYPIIVWALARRQD